MEFTAAEIAGLIKGKVIGDQGIKVHGFSSIEEGKHGHLYFILNNFLRKRLGRRFYFRESSFDYGFTEVREYKVRAVFPEFNCLNNISIIQFCKSSDVLFICFVEIGFV